MMTNTAFMKALDAIRQKHHLTVQRFCEDIGADADDYKYYLKGVKTPKAGFVLAAVKYFGIEEF